MICIRLMCIWWEMFDSITKFSCCRLSSCMALRAAIESEFGEVPPVAARWAAAFAWAALICSTTGFTWSLSAQAAVSLDCSSRDSSGQATRRAAQ